MFLYEKTSHVGRGYQLHPVLQVQTRHHLHMAFRVFQNSERENLVFARYHMSFGSWIGAITIAAVLFVLLQLVQIGIGAVESHERSV